MSKGKTESKDVIVFKQIKSGAVKKNLGFLRNRWKPIVIILLLALITFLTYGYLTTKNQLNQLANSGKSGQSEVQKITNQVGKTIQLPSEAPTIATVTNVDKLKSQTFFKNAHNGDRVLIYSNSGRALLYRPSTGKVIEYSLVDFGNSQ